jgi:dTDP-4-amino-4,6-dideoxygalactose transaminase
MGLSDSQARLGTDRLRRLPSDVQRRRAIAHRYSEALSAAGRTVAAEPPAAEHAFLRYPMRVADRGRFQSAAERAGIDVGDWFSSPVHPVTTQLRRWGYDAGSAPNAEQAWREIVNLPTDPKLRDHDVERVLSLLQESVDVIR